MADSVYKRFGTSALAGTNQQQTQHTLLANDTLPKLAAFYFNTGYDSELWRQIAEAQNPPIDDLDALTVGTVIIIPAPKASAT